MIRVMRLYAVSCDYESCDEWSDEHLPEYSDPHKARTIRRYVRTFGWVHRDGRDLCPQHAIRKEERKDR